MGDPSDEDGMSTDEAEDPSDEDGMSTDESEDEQARDGMKEGSSSTSDDMRFLPSDEVLISDFLTTKITNIPYRGNDYIKVIDGNPHDLGFFEPEVILEDCYVDGRLEPERYFYLPRPAAPELLTGRTGQWRSSPNSVMEFIKAGVEARGQRKAFQFIVTRAAGFVFHHPTDWRLDQYRLFPPPGGTPPPGQNWDWTLYKLSKGPLTQPSSSYVSGDEQAGTSQLWDGQNADDDSGGGDAGASISV